MKHGWFKVLILIWPIGVIGQGSSPLAFVGFVAFLLVLLRYFSLKLILSVSDNSIKGVPMKTTSTVRIFVSSILETIWAAGVGGVVGHLSTKLNSSHNNYSQQDNISLALHVCLCCRRYV